VECFIFSEEQRTKTDLYFFYILYFFNVNTTFNLKIYFN